MPGAQDSGISVRAFAIGAILVVVAVGATVWFAIPSPDAKLRFVSPSGSRALELGELCSGGACRRVAVFEETTAEGDKRRLGCELPLTQTHPVLPRARVTWASNEAAAEITFVEPDGAEGNLRLEFVADCTATGA